MKCNLEECKKVIDEIVFNDPEVKELVAKGWVKPESEFEYDYIVKGQTSLNYHYRFFGGDWWTEARALNQEDGEYLFGFSGEDALKNAANHVLWFLHNHCSLKHKEEYDRAIEEEYSEPYRTREYNGD